jgi:hypothetical protein
MMFMFGSVFARFFRLKVNETADRQSRGGHESNKFSCHCLVLFLVF